MLSTSTSVDLQEVSTSGPALFFCICICENLLSVINYLQSQTLQIS